MTISKYSRVSAVAVAFVAFVLGCVAESLVGVRFASPVRAGTQPSRWEYECFDSHNPIEKANVVGASGWELVLAMRGGGPDGDRWCFKRALP
jgi:hypothetical protein